MLNNRILRGDNLSSTISRSGQSHPATFCHLIKWIENTGNSTHSINNGIDNIYNNGLDRSNGHGGRLVASGEPLPSRPLRLRTV